VRNTIAECGCPSPFIRDRYSGSQGDCRLLNHTYLIDPATNTYPEVNEKQLKRAMEVLSEFDLVIPTEYLAHPLLARFVLWKMNWLVSCDGVIVTKDGNTLHYPHIQFQHEHKIEDEYLKLLKSRSRKPEQKDSELYASRPMPDCIRKEITEQNSLDSKLYKWVEAKFLEEISLFESLGPNTTCVHQER
jgi:hypothetical protein